MNIFMRLFTALFLLIFFSACSSESGFTDIDQFMDEVKAKPRGKIEPLPEFANYESFSYSAAGLRSPFEAPLVIQAVKRAVASNPNVKPDENRAKEFLESFNLTSLTMVGTLSRKDTLFALISDADGGVHRVSAGDYLGSNHGRVLGIGEEKLDLIEIVPDGQGGWLERPRSVLIKGVELEP